MPSDKSRRSPSGPVSQYKYTPDPITGSGRDMTCSARTVTTFQVTVDYARVGDVSLVNAVTPVGGNVAMLTGLGVGGSRVATTDVVEFEVINPTAGDIVPTTIAVIVEIFRAPMNGYLE